MAGVYIVKINFERGDAVKQCIHKYIMQIKNDFKETYMGGGAWCKAPEMSMSRGIYYANCTD